MKGYLYQLSSLRGMYTRSNLSCTNRHLPLSIISNPLHWQHTSNPSDNPDERPDIPMPVGRRPVPNPNIPPPSLVLPPPVKYVGRTTRKMLQTEAEKYLYPLYLRGWHVEDIRIRGKKDRGLRTPFLVNKFGLKNNSALRKTVGMILELEETERHDISYEVVLKETPELALRLQTHSARTFPPASKSNVTFPNVTLRDVRFAVLFEKFLQEKAYLYDQTLHEKTIHLLVRWDTLLSRFPFTDT